MGDFIYSLMFGAGVAAFAYNTLARRVGYGNNKGVAKLVLAIFVIAVIFFFTILKFIIGVK
jgi:hypothetical protein